MTLLVFKKTAALIVAGIILGSGTICAAQPDANGKTKPPEEGLIVKFKSQATEAEIEDAIREGGLKLRRHVQTAPMHKKGHTGLTLVETAAPAEEAIGRLRNHPAVEYIEPNYTYTHQLASDDTYVTAGYVWGMYGDLSSPANAYGSQAAEAWNSDYVGTRDVYVAVIDEGIQTTHADLQPNIWSNPFDPADGVDNDRNGYVDDIHGWNFHADRNVVFDAAAGDTHGTHVAGTIGAKGGNGLGVAGVNWNVTLISGKFLSGGSGSTLDAVEAIDYFVDLKTRHNLNIAAINASWGGGGYSRSLHDAIIRAAKAGILFVAAAGNDSLSNDLIGSYPANMDTRQGTSTESAADYNAVISVAAIDKNGALAVFSNYGANRVHLGAPGVRILSTYPDGFAYMDGTSMATPHVTGAVALYASTHPGASAQAIRDAILGGVLPTPSLAGKTATGGRLNLSSIISSVPPGPQPPPAPTGVTAKAGNATVTVSWAEASGASSYTVQRSTTSGGPYTTLAASLTSLTYTDSNVSNNTTYYYVVVAVNSTGSSAPSAEVSATPKAPPGVPTGVSAVAGQALVSSTAPITVSWNASAGAGSYNVKRSTSSSGPWTVVGSGLTSQTYTQNVTANGASYYYTVSAVNSAGESASSTVASAVPLPPGPSDLIASASSSSQVQLRWIDHSADEQGFKIEYWSGLWWSQIGTVSAGVTSVNLTGTSSRRTYYFRIRAYKGTLNTSYSNTASVTTP